MNVLGALEPNVFKSLLRRLTVSAIVLGFGGVVVALLVAPPLSAVGVGLGVAIGFLNVRAIDRQVSHTHVDAEVSNKALRRMVGSRTMLRLALITAVVLVLVFIEPPLGIGIVVGLVIFQLAFVGNVIGAMLAQGGAA
ncbi:MAG TPA: ATP synthase subunit I [Acidimicrobiales bacterium]|nr:ATP synthase subunit I [Acidimicrobiales bacterium]